MNIYFSGIGGVGIGPLALIALDAGHTVQGSDPNDSEMIHRLSARHIPINNKQQGAFLQACHSMKPLDWLVYSSALPDNHPELVMAKMLGIRISKRDEFIAHLLKETELQLIAVAGTHGKTSTTSMLIWAMQQLGVPVSYSVGSTLSFGESGHYDPHSRYFIYECDEYDRNFLHFHPHLSLITSMDYDHPDTYPTAESYIQAFNQFIAQSESALMWRRDGALLGAQNITLYDDADVLDLALPGLHTRQNATLVAHALEKLGIPGNRTRAIESFPGADRRFEKLLPGLYTDYGHHPTEIAATLQMARELNDHVVLVYQPHQNVRQHEVRALYTDCFEDAEMVYWLPTHLSRENHQLPILTADELTENVTNIEAVYTAELDDELWQAIQTARDEGKLVICMGAGSIDTWVRERANTPHIAQLLIKTTDDHYLLHQVPNAQQLTLFSTDVQPTDASPLAAARRIISEQTTLEPREPSFFKLDAHIPDTHQTNGYRVFYTISDVDTSQFQLTIDGTWKTVDPTELRTQPISLLARTIITEYAQPYRIIDPSQEN